MAEYQLKPGKVGQKVIDGYKKVEEKFTDTFLEKDENSPSGYTLKTGQDRRKSYRSVPKNRGGCRRSLQKSRKCICRSFFRES